MINLLFTVILTIISTVIQIVLWPLNQLITSMLPSVASQITSVTTSLNTLLEGLVWAIGIIPDPIITTLLLVLGFEVIIMNIKMSTRSVAKLWLIVGRLKFW